MQKLIAEFDTTNEDGEVVRLFVYQEQVKTPTRGGSSLANGMKSIKTIDGSAVNRLEKGRYEVVETGEGLESDDPNAP